MNATRSLRVSARQTLAPALLALLTLACVAGPQEAADGPAEASLESLSAEDASRHVHYLASDAMAGRDTGSPEALEAAAYIADAFRQAGLEPGGDDGGFLADIGHAGLALAGPTVLEALSEDGARSLAHGVDWLMMRPGFAAGTFEVVVVDRLEALPAAPDPRVALLLDADMRTTRTWMRDRTLDGGAGYGLVLRAGPTEAGAPRAPFLRVLASADSPMQLMLRGEVLDDLRSGRASRLRLEMEAVGDPVPAVNVVGVLPGVGTAERPGLAEEILVFSAHYDHIGTLAPGDDPEADLVFNGADDDASGVVALIELAEIFASGPAPARTLVFLAATGEELGLLGTYDYIERPVGSLEDTICNVNFEMIGRPDSLAGGPGKLFLTGFERTNLGAAWEALGLPIVPDPRPEQQYFFRSDNIAFARLGIVAQTLSSGGDNEDYHRVTDEADRLDYDHMATVIEACYRATAPLADGTLDPVWEPGGAP